MVQLNGQVNAEQPARGGALAHIAEPLRTLAVPVDSLNLDPSNARTHPEKNLAAIKASLARFGQRQPVVVQREGMIVRAGNGRVMAARAMGWTHVAALVVDESAIDATAFAIADNRTSDLAEWDDGTLARLLESLPSDLKEAAGYTDGEVSELLASLEADGGGAAPSLADRFGVPPFSVLDARAGYWQDRKRQWLAMGIQSELGRGGDGYATISGSPLPLDRERER